MTGDFNIVKLKIYEKSARNCNLSRDENKVLYLCVLKKTSLRLYEHENEHENLK